jgi:N-ethylmaleimide reductase
VGRISDPLFLGGDLPVAPSAIQPQGHVSLVRPVKPYVTPRALAKVFLARYVHQEEYAGQA